jgi:hypothetical protein
MKPECCKLNEKQRDAKCLDGSPSLDNQIFYVRMTYTICHKLASIKTVVFRKMQGFHSRVEAENRILTKQKSLNDHV